MKEKDIRDLYPITPQAHGRIAATLAALPEKSGSKAAHRRWRGALAVIAALILLGMLTSVAYATNLFGLIAKKVGNYGLNLSVVKETDEADSAATEAAAQTKEPHVRLKLGYIPEGYMPITGEDGFTEPYQFSYGGKPLSDRWGFSFLLYSADDYDKTEIGIVDSHEETVDGRKIIFMTEQFDADGEWVQYLAAKYFEEWNTVVVGYCTEETELERIMRALELEEDTGFVETETFADDFYDPVDDYTFLGYDENYRFITVGESFGYSPQIVDDGSEQESEFTVQVKKVEECNSFDGLDRGAFLYGDRYSAYFDSDGRLISTYLRDDWEYGDGIDDLTRHWQTETQRHFILVTVEATANVGQSYFDGFGVWSAPLERQPDGSIGYPDTHGGSVLVYSDVAPDIGSIWRKGETRTLVYGISVDDEVLDMGCLIFQTKKTVLDHNAKTAMRVDDNVCVRLKGGAV